MISIQCKSTGNFLFHHCRLFNNITSSERYTQHILIIAKTVKLGAGGGEVGSHRTQHLFHSSLQVLIETFFVPKDTERVTRFRHAEMDVNLHIKCPLKLPQVNK